jgi:CRP-like cAMP-binding protein
VAKTVHLPLTQEDLADAVGLTPIHVNRTLRKMKAEKLIKCGKGNIVVLDEQALKKIACFDMRLLETGSIF